MLNLKKTGRKNSHKINANLKLVGFKCLVRETGQII